MVVSWGGVLFENSIVCFFGFEQIVFVWKCDTNYFIYFLIDDRLWFQLCKRGSWLRTNAGGVLNTCKSNDEAVLAPWISGERVSNT